MDTNHLLSTVTSSSNKKATHKTVENVPKYHFRIQKIHSIKNPFLFRFVDSDEPTWRGYFYIITLIIVTIFNTIVNAQALFVQYEIGLKIKTALISAIYRKSLKLSSNGRREMTVGETTNLMAIDSQRFMDVVPYLNMAWSSPLGESNILFTV